jgi:membrane protease YdiL (CAAX protease family)
VSDRKPVTTRASGITLGSTVAGYVGAWVLGQLLFALAVVVAEGTGAVDLADDDPVPIPLLFVGTMLSWSAFVLMVWWLSQREGTGSLRRDVGLRFEWRDLIGLPIGAATQLVVLPALYWPLNELWPGTFNEDKLSENAEELIDRANGIGVFLLILMVVVGAPIVEEIVYRGFVQGALVRRFGPPIGLIVAAAFFALIHFRPIEYPGLFVAGLVFGGCALVSGRLGPAIAAHLAFNAIGLLVAAG